MFPLHYSESNFTAIWTTFLPILQAHNFDLYLCGHEHLLGYSEVDTTTALSENYVRNVQEKEKNLQSEENCIYDITTTFSQGSGHSRDIPQGRLQQITVGNTAKPQYSICVDRQQACQFYYAENTHFSWI